MADEVQCDQEDSQHSSIGSIRVVWECEISPLLLRSLSCYLYGNSNLPDRARSVPFAKRWKDSDCPFNDPKLLN